MWSDIFFTPYFEQHYGQTKVSNSLLQHIATLIIRPHINQIASLSKITVYSLKLVCSSSHFAYQSKINLQKLCPVPTSTLLLKICYKTTPPKLKYHKCPFPQFPHFERLLRLGVIGWIIHAEILTFSISECDFFGKRLLQINYLG